MAISKVIYAGETLIDLTADTVEASKMLAGTTAHGADGEVVTGTCTYDTDTKDATATAAEILTGKTAYKNGNKITGEMPNNGSTTLVISGVSDTITIARGYHDGGGRVAINVTEKQKLIPENIRDGVTILGVEGSMSGTEDAKPQQRTVTPSTETQNIIPEEGYNYLSEVIVNPIPYSESANASGGTTVTIG